jgi:hypothetical protein
MLSENKNFEMRQIFGFRWVSIMPGQGGANEPSVAN